MCFVLLRERLHLFYEVSTALSDGGYVLGEEHSAVLIQSLAHGLSTSLNLVED